MKALRLLGVVLIVALAVLAGCASPVAAPETGASPCGTFSTYRLRLDLQNPFRTDREWYETLIRRLAWQLDCERGRSS